MGTAGTPKSYKSEIRRVTRTNPVKGGIIPPNSEVVDNYGGFVARVGLAISGDNTTTTYSTDDAPVVFGNDEDVHIVTPEVYEAWSGVAIWNFFKGLLEVREETTGSMTAVFNDVLFDVYPGDTVDDLGNRWDQNRNAIRANRTSPYRA